MNFEEEEVTTSNKATFYFNKYKTLYQYYLDQTTPHVRYRWAGLIVLVLLFVLRVVLYEGWYVVCYGLGIYLLNQFLAFLTPKFDMSLQQAEKNNELESGDMADEFRPFIRRLPEFKFWHNSIRATLLSHFLATFSVFDIPVYWPILLIYFILLFALTMRRQINHMIKYKYLPLDIGKKKYSHK
ncbi:AAL002Wp [Eremothecium gossypii ATCC 10895]|uniref:Protein RER1 n=1 Tax=Eremothecium gossypii (strain ATCC 10895 / CBS 109.51 / FGSC 9923 / NRRL Y-1056) TaxID=284811 RepID=Q75ET0_EREGS|nr:AAL002Wp [Eremothecium gossypii ATCC 10895]AAS50364.1 AAL002Wp [Eremothecium gossypii ATCC 10895]AEY94650.1 FAAL002Wp [Eremothecium gossypii FDAG1]